ncbi:15768_t:CDS:2, partial [Dentiscutata erythropus]
MARGNFKARRHSKHSTANEFGIERKQPRDWISKKPDLLKFQEAKSQQKTVSRYMIQAKAHTLYATSQYQEKYGEIQNNKFSQKWVDRFMFRNNLRCKNDYPLSLIGNMDETAMFFSMSSNTTIEQRADRTKLPPLIIFKLVKVSCKNFPDSVIIRANPSGWMNENKMLWWIENIWTRRAQCGNNLCSLLILDLFAGYKTDPVKRHFWEKNTDLALIPKGLTSRLQPLNVSMNKSENNNESNGEPDSENNIDGEDMNENEKFTQDSQVIPSIGTVIMSNVDTFAFSEEVEIVFETEPSSSEIDSKANSDL